MAQLVRRTLRMNPDRVIVGEVLGPEVVTMLNAMSQGNDGSLSTIHARTPRGVFDRIATYARQAAERLDLDATHQLIAGGEGGTGALDFVVFLRKTRSRWRRAPARSVTRRFVSSVLEVNGYDRRVQASEIFTPGADGRAVRNQRVPIGCLADLHATSATTRSTDQTLTTISTQAHCTGPRGGDMACDRRSLATRGLRRARRRGVAAGRRLSLRPRASRTRAGGDRRRGSPR